GRRGRCSVPQRFLRCLPRECGSSLRIPLLCKRLEGANAIRRNQSHSSSQQTPDSWLCFSLSHRRPELLRPTRPPPWPTSTRSRCPAQKPQQERTRSQRRKLIVREY